MKTLRNESLVLVEAQIIEIGENSQGEVAYRIAFPNGAHFWIDGEHVSPALETIEVNGEKVIRVLNQD